MYCALYFGTANVSQMRYKSNAPGLKLNFYEPYVDMPTPDAMGNWW